MTTKEKTTTRKQAARKLKVRKETIRDLNVGSKGKDVKGGSNLQVTCFLCHTK